MRNPGPMAQNIPKCITIHKILHILMKDPIAPSFMPGDQLKPLQVETYYRSIKKRAISNRAPCQQPNAGGSLPFGNFLFQTSCLKITIPHRAFLQQNRTKTHQHFTQIKIPKEINPRKYEPECIKPVCRALSIFPNYPTGLLSKQLFQSAFGRFGPELAPMTRLAKAYNGSCRTLTETGRKPENSHLQIMMQTTARPAVGLIMVANPPAYARSSLCI
ncbi:MAG: hypothetical protein DWH73_00675 [Planctomycetota bacterium]|nr:MAG: hypothetical protein DWH73_00675 [Planctomycetota bacterium]